MARDEQLAAEVRRDQGPPTLRIYGWDRPAVSLGRRQDPDDLPAGLLSRDLPLVRRPTGGGAVVHRPDELTYAVAIPATLVPEGIRRSDLPGLFHRAFRDLLVAREFFPAADLTVAESDSGGPVTLCFNAPVRGDLLLEGRKVAGSALRAWRDGLLVQGSLQGFPLGYNQLIEALVLLVEKEFMA